MTLGMPVVHAMLAIVVHRSYPVVHLHVREPRCFRFGRVDVPSSSMNLGVTTLEFGLHGFRSNAFFPGVVVTDVVMTNVVVTNVVMTDSVVRVFLVIIVVVVVIIVVVVTCAHDVIRHILFFYM